MAKKIAGSAEDAAVKWVLESMKEAENEETLDLVLSEEDAVAPLLEECYCPKCKSDKIEIYEQDESYTERALFVLDCLDCGTRFVLLEDLGKSCQRGIMNAEKKISYEKAKIKYFKKVLL